MWNLKLQKCAGPHLMYKLWYESLEYSFWRRNSDSIRPRVLFISMEACSNNAVSVCLNWLCENGVCLTEIGTVIKCRNVLITRVLRQVSWGGGMGRYIAGRHGGESRRNVRAWSRIRWPDPRVRPARDCGRPLTNTSCLTGWNFNWDTTSLRLCVVFHISWSQVSVQYLTLC